MMIDAGKVKGAKVRIGDKKRWKSTMIRGKVKDVRTMKIAGKTPTEDLGIADQPLAGESMQD
ncbi:MAG TPA: hypothetical protein DCS82_06370 [Rhodospirillaceae bacterium]|nr:hypothetical protein [Rhodospirillaceae bacterium]